MSGNVTAVVTAVVAVVTAVVVVAAAVVAETHQPPGRVIRDSMTSKNYTKKPVLWHVFA